MVFEPGGQAAEDRAISALVAEAGAAGLGTSSLVSRAGVDPGVHEVLFDLIDELVAACEAEAFHAGMDEVFYIADAKCPRCAGRDPAELFARGIVLEIYFDGAKTPAVHCPVADFFGDGCGGRPCACPPVAAMSDRNRAAPLLPT